MTDREPLLAVEIIRLAEVQLEDTLSIALASDQRATSQANTLSAISAGLVVVGVGLATQATPQIILAAIAFISAGLFIAAAGVAMWAATPNLFYARGFSPKLTLDATSFSELCEWSIADMEKRLSANRNSLAKSARLTRVSQFSALSAVVVPLILLMILRCHL